MPHTPPVSRPPRHQRTVPLGTDAGTVAGHRLVLLSLEVWDAWVDLRFARVDEDGTRPLPRRVPPPDAWTATLDGAPLQVFDAVGRGDRAFSNGEVRLVPGVGPAGGVLRLRVSLLDGADPLEVEVVVPPA
ncbi:MAG: hypothetical protein ACLGIR_09845 [Actinomycetes bacterium]